MTDEENPRLLRVLVVDDDAMLRAACAALLREWGYEVIEAGDGMEALDRLSEEAVHGVLLDVNMPRMRGDQLLEALSKRDCRLPVLVMSSENPDTQAKVLGLGARGFLAKPFAAARLRAEIARIVD